MYSLWVDGYQATRIAAHSAPTWEISADGGCGELKVSFSVEAGFEHQALQRGRSVQVKVGLFAVYWGRVVDYDRNTGELIAGGEFGRNKLALDGAGNATRDLGVAISAAIGRGWNVTNPGSVGGVATGTGSGVQTVADLAREVADQSNTWIGINGRGEFYQTATPTTHRWLLAPGAVALAPTTEGMADFYAVRYFDGTNYVTVTLGTSGEEAEIDLTDRGTLTGAEASSIAANMNAKYQKRLAWTGGMEVPRHQITTRGGTPSALVDVMPLEMVRIPGLPVFSANALWLDEVIGKVRYTAGADSIYIEPVATAPRNFVDVMAAA